MKFFLTFMLTYFSLFTSAQSDLCKPNVPVAVVIDSIFYNEKNKVSMECMPCYVFRTTDDRFKVTELTIQIDACEPFLLLKDIDVINVVGDTMTPKDSRNLKNAFKKYPIWFGCVKSSFSTGALYILQPLYHDQRGFRRI